MTFYKKHSSAVGLDDAPVLLGAEAVVCEFETYQRQFSTSLCLYFKYIYMHVEILSSTVQNPICV